MSWKTDVKLRPKRADHTVAGEVLKLASRYRQLFGGEVVRDTELKPLELQLLLAIYLEPKATLEQISDRLGSSRPTLSHALMTLCNQGLVDDQEHSKDGRRRERSINDAGINLIANFCREYEQTHRV